LTTPLIQGQFREGALIVDSSKFPTSTAPREIGRYRLVAELARGGMGIVYLVAAQGPAGFSKLLVIKEIKPEYLQDKAFLTMFLDEARLAARLNHPNIVQTIEVGVDGDRHFMVMEYLEGRTLHRILHRFASQGGFPLNAQLRILSEALNGLHHAHQLKDFDGTDLGIVHRDMSPQNIFVTFDGQTKVVDFGIAKAYDSSYETRTGILKGRVAYMAPEQACGEKVDCRADVYSLGVLLWEAIAGRRLWGKMTDVEVLTKVIKEQIPLTSEAKPDAPAELQRICTKAMARQRDERYETAAAFQEDLESYLASLEAKTSMREVGPVVASAFAEDRAKMHAFIESSLAAFRSGDRRSGPLPRVEGVQNSTTPHGSESGPSHPSTQLALAPSSLRPADQGESLAVPHSGQSQGGRSIMGESSGRARKTVALVVLGGSVAAALGVYLYLGSHEHPAGPPQPAAVSFQAERPATPQGSPAPQPALVTVSIKATPVTAQIMLDGIPRSNPVDISYPRGTGSHTVRVTADGYVPKTEQISFESNLMVEMALERQRATPTWTPPAPRIAAAAPAKRVTTAVAAPIAQPVEPPAPQPVEVNPSGGRPPQRPIDPTNPYGNQ
jgi:serine/threonine-protein kinase